jgi:hypothetical protein
MRTGTHAAALLISLALATPGFAQSTSNTFSLTPNQYTYTVVDTSKASVTSKAAGPNSLSSLQPLPLNVTKALQQSAGSVSLANRDPTRALQPRQATSNFQIPNLFSRITTFGFVPNFFQARAGSTTFPSMGPQKQ